MIVVDTNVLVRFTIRDDEIQFKRSERLLRESETLLLPSTLMEFEWVVRSLYGIARAEIAGAMLGICGLPRVKLDEGDVIERAIQAYAGGLDLADAIFILQAEARGVGRFATFDKQLIKRCARISKIVEAVSP